MLLHASEQLRIASAVRIEQPVPRYSKAAHLVDAMRLLLGYFEGYMDSVPKMTQVRDVVGIINGQLWEGIVSLFWEARCQEGYKGRNDDAGADTTTTAGVEDCRRWCRKHSPMPVLSPMPLAQNRENGSRQLRQTLPEGIQRIVQSESCGRDEDEVSWKGWGGAAMPSFKRDDLGKDAAGNDRGGGLAAPSGSLSLEAIEKRFTWYWNKLLRSVQLQSDRVFPPRWNVHYRLMV